jgi:hypothetical protein
LLFCRHNAGIQLLQLQGHQGEVFMCLWNPVTKQLASGYVRR